MLFIDRNGELFEHILQFMRAGNIDAHRLHDHLQEIKLYKLLINEAKFYNLDAMIAYLEEKLKFEHFPLVFNYLNLILKG